VPTASRRSWTLPAAREMLAEVRRRTELSVQEAEKLLQQRDAALEGSPERASLETTLRQVVSHWVRSMEALGVEVKGLWLIDFDNGEGYYCWRWPEGELAYFHGYDEGFSGRVRIQ